MQLAKYVGGIARLLLVALGPLIAFADVPQHEVRIEGNGPRVVVFEAGLGDTLDVWQEIQPRIAAKCARTFAYSRAGYLGSDVPAAARDAATIVGELREELRRQHLSPPYVLVGHSLGGLYMQYFARNFPGDVKGLVLIDSTHWHQGLTIDAGANTLYQTRKTVTLFMPWIERREVNESTEAGREVHESPIAGSVPTIVLSSTKLWHGETEDQRARAITLQNDIAADFPAARHVFVEDSGHYIQREHPEAVIEAIRDVAGCELVARR